ncbi:MAG: Rieske 2Fe-2S domain-containing protein [Chloroflexi bacterium]|nr:Rieske 2Fe-2S domain-containing protein [Chloroflexota bacterium]
MLKPEQNQALMEVGPGTLMGGLLRRYWTPFAAAAEMDKQTTKAVRLMGEDLVLYKDLSGNFGLVDRHCPHRRADLSYGWVEECGLRCNYHGWKFDHTGACIDQPFEEIAHPDAHFKDRITIKSYPVEARAGLLWAYMGPLPAPEVPIWEPFTWSNGFVQIVLSEIPCNWFQCQENSIDPVHFEWLHDTWGQRSNCLFTGNHFEWRVPIDDGRTLSVGWFFDRVPEEMEPFRQERIPYWYGPVKDEQTGRWIESHVMNQDFIAWAGQGGVADRTQEHLGESDRGIILMRKRMLEEAEKVRAGGEAKGTIRDPKLARFVELPIVGRDFFLAGYSMRDVGTGSPLRYPKNFVFQAGQPGQITEAYREAMGMLPDGSPRLEVISSVER